MKAGFQQSQSEAEFWERSSYRGAAIGALFLAGFGAAWVFLAVASLPGSFLRFHAVAGKPTLTISAFSRHGAWLYVALAIPPLVLLWRAIDRLRHASGEVPPEFKPLSRRIGRQFGIVNAVQWTAIGLLNFWPRACIAKI